MKQRMDLDERRYNLNSKLSFLLAQKEVVRYLYINHIWKVWQIVHMHRQHENILKKFQNDKDVNKDFKHETDVIDSIDEQYPEEGYFVTNCTKCTNAPSCHDKCIYENDSDKEKT